MFVYNVHTPSKTFALANKDGESYDDLVERMCAKGGVGKDDIAAVKARKDGAGLVYEHENGRWALEDDGDLAIFQSRFPATTSTSATLHLTSPHPRAHFANGPPLPTASSALKKKVQSKASSQSPEKEKTDRTPQQGQFVRTTHGNFVPRARDTSHSTITTLSLAPPPDPPSVRPKSKANGGIPTHTHGPSGGKLLPQIEATGDIMSRPHNIASIVPELPDFKHEFDKYEKTIGHTADGAAIAKPRSVVSTRSRRSKWGDEDHEKWWDIHKQRWMDFHANNGVRTVVGKAGGVDDVRMLLKPGYRKVYVSRSFAIKNGLVNDKYAMGAAGYSGIKILGPISITVGTRTAEHQAMINEEQHFDIVLGRSWVEKMAVKVDPLDQTSVTYMDSGETIPCDLVVLKDPQGNLITIT